MKKWYVYELYNLVGTVEHVGESINPIIRFYDHTKRKPIAGHGYFYNRQDIQMNIVKEFDNRREALDCQYELQEHYGLKTDKDKISESNKGKSKSPKTAEHKLKLSMAQKGKTFLEEHKKKMSESAKLAWEKRKSSPSIT
jgi:predicted GIY-YIG superfamily endonuclease